MISLSVGHLKQDQKNKDAMLANILIALPRPKYF